MIPDSCNDCRYWARKERRPDSKGLPTWVGECRKSLPQFISGRGDWAYWPVSFAHEWCAEGYPKEGEDP